MLENYGLRGNQLIKRIEGCIDGKNSKALKFIELLLNHEMVINLDKYEDQGVKVTTHTYDVLKISYEEIKEILVA